MELTEKQKKGLDIAVQRYFDGERYTIISGYAGTGKSTLVKFIISALNADEDEVVYTSFTGKATQVLSKKGNKNTSTLHKLLFTSHPRPDGTFVRIPVPSIPYRIVVVDEISMVPNSLMTRLMSYNVYIIGLGDPFQLPPVDKNEDNHLLDNPHIFLDEIMRQAAESEIIKLTMDIRAGKPLELFKGKEVQVLSKSELNTGMLMWADQIICATNATRTSINNQMRDLLGRGDQPEDGDKVIKSSYIVEIIEARIEQIFELVNKDITANGLKQNINTVILIGQGIANISKSDIVGRITLNIPVKMATTKALNSVRPTYSTAYALVKYIASRPFIKTVSSNVDSKSDENFFSKVWDRIKEFFYS